jgi:hypothetical protein
LTSLAVTVTTTTGAGAAAIALATRVAKSLARHSADDAAAADAPARADRTQDAGGGR